MEPANMKPMNHSFRLALIIVLGLFLGGVALELPHAKHISRDQLVIEMSQKDLTRLSAAIVVGTVAKKVNSVREADPNGDTVFTRWRVAVGQPLKGTPPSSIIVRTAGGTYGMTTMDVEDAPHLSPGDHVLLYVEPFPGTKDYRIVGEFQGKYAVTGATGNEVVEQQETGKRSTLVSVKQAVLDIAPATQ